MKLLFLFIGVYALHGADVTGNWTIRITAQGEQVAFGNVTIEQLDDTVRFKFSGVEFAGTVDHSKISVKSTAKEGSASLVGTLREGNMQGDAILPSGLPGKWVAVRSKPLARDSKIHEFTPEVFQRYLSASIPPVLRIRPGDTVRTWSVDAGGRDAQDKVRSLGGNPLTGPFYIEGANPGDTLVVKLVKVQLNRNWAGSGKGVMGNAVSPWYIRDVKEDKNLDPRWTIENGSAALSKPTAALKNFRVPLKPMLGCIGVAPRGGDVINTRDSGGHGGNMDYNQIQEGTTVYLPVNHPGALLFVGDGHAAQGDGELTGDALETSMNIEFQVDVIQNAGKDRIGVPYAENEEYLMMIGIGGSLDQALQTATTAMALWLEKEYKLTSAETAVVLGFAIKYDIADLVGTQVSIVAKLPKTTLAQLKQ